MNYEFNIADIIQTGIFALMYIGVMRNMKRDVKNDTKTDIEQRARDKRELEDQRAKDLKQHTEDKDKINFEIQKINLELKDVRLYQNQLEKQMMAIEKSHDKNNEVFHNLIAKIENLITELTKEIHALQEKYNNRITEHVEKYHREY